MLLLGDELIRDQGIAVFELVKNAYDADASRCTIQLIDVSETADGARVIVEDNGCGMDLHTIRHVWLEPATPNRKKQRQISARTPKYNRLPLGEKGVGRFAVHKLGKAVQIVTRMAGKKEIVIDIDWRDFKESAYLEDVPIKVQVREPEVFTGERTGSGPRR